MSVLIKGMEMPKSCFNCRCPRACQAITKRIDEMDRKEWFPQDHRHSDCPLIEVPEPHGRLGDLDALPWYLANEPVKYASYEDWEKLCDAIETAPAVIPASEEAE